jgi:hypothetical protein
MKKHDGDDERHLYKEGGIKYTPRCPCEIATVAIVRPSKYRRKRCRRHGKNMIISTFYRLDAKRNIPISYKVIVIIVINCGGVIVVVVSVDKL